jgi:hypothetical protein
MELPTATIDCRSKSVLIDGKLLLTVYVNWFNSKMLHYLLVEIHTHSEHSIKFICFFFVYWYSSIMALSSLHTLDLDISCIVAK